MFNRASTSIHFPTFLLPPTPFRGNRPRADSSSSSSMSPTNSPTEDNYFKGHVSHLRCAKCAVDVCLTSQIISKGFTGRHGRAYLVSPLSPFTTSGAVQSPQSLGLPNTKTDTPSQRQLVTGIHTVSDVRCSFCGSMLGWKYDGAEEESQKYKVGKYILETRMVCSSSDWEHENVDFGGSSTMKSGTGTAGQTLDLEDVQFDSEDEDECEDLFAGVWSPHLASKRRQNKKFPKPALDGAC